ncbi:SCO-spondin-like [Aplysia californica]|uniref:SCO-spondin-like n=1 Tax=Aplysia californica TaxID=6500 RepID=A0ABM1VUM0_APLCA|nr:SCO-spondin-like [Aplysia californica]
MAIPAGLVLCGVLVMTLMSAQPAQAGKSNKGTEFILGFMDNSVALEVFVTTMANTPASVTVTTPLYDPSWQATATVARQQVELLLVPLELRVSGTGKENKGIHIVASEEITVYCVNKERMSTDAYVGIPVHTVGTEYYSMSYIRYAQILLIGIEDNTQFTVRLSDNDRTGTLTWVNPVSIDYNGQNYGNGDTLSETINRYQTFFITQYGDDYSDLTGSHIVSTKPVAAISGNFRGRVPIDSAPRKSTDHLTEMILPVDTWGKDFITISTPERTIGDLFRVVASEDNTHVNFGNGAITFTLQLAGDFKEVDIPTDTHYYVTSDKPVSIAMVGKSWQDDGPTMGDPSMSLLIPIPQFISEITWSTIYLPQGGPFNDKINIIIRKNKESGLLLDDNPMSVLVCNPTAPVAGDDVDNDCDGYVDEETDNGVVNGGWGTWASWGSCSVTCASGTQTRTRACNRPTPVNGAYCPGGDSETQTCSLSACPIDGGWGTWSGWGSCSVTCGIVGTKTRSRSCDRPTKQHGGADCPGSDQDTGSCDMTHNPCSVDGGWGTWGSWSSCSVTCASGSQTRTRACDRPVPYNGAPCSGDDQQTQTCSLSPCPVDGGWGTWDAWGTCSLSCGAVGNRERSRTCDRPVAQHGGANCAGSGQETGNCDMSHILCVVDGNWGSWGAWATCSVTCATGSTTRARACDDPAPLNGGNYCVGDQDETTSCTLSPCPVDGGWGTWSAYGACSVTCGTGIKTRSRLCDRPAPAHLGADCPGINAEDDNCTLSPCPIDGGWGTWSAWSACSVTCEGTGDMERDRACDRPAAQYGGADCAGSNVEHTHTHSHTHAHTLSPPSPSTLVLPYCLSIFTIQFIFLNNTSSPQGGSCQDLRGLFDCKNGVQCINIIEKCDCKPHCSDFSDEDPEYAGCVMSLQECYNVAGRVLSPHLLLLLLASAVTMLFTVLSSVI